MPAVCVGIPFVSNIVISKKVISALAMDRAANMQAENVWKRKLEKWEEFRLGIDGIAKFKSIVECRRQEMNIRYAKKACMRQIVPSKVVFAITDSYVEESTLSVSSRSYVDKCFEVYMERGFFDDLNWSKWRFDLDRPMSSFGAFVTEIKYQGKSYCVGIKISEVGDILLCMDGKGIKYLEKEFKSWDEMLKFLDNKIGIEA